MRAKKSRSYYSGPEGVHRLKHKACKEFSFLKDHFLGQNIRPKKLCRIILVGKERGENRVISLKRLEVRKQG